MRRPAARVKPRIAKLQSFPAPVHGWIANVNLAQPKARWKDGTSLQGAYQLENWFPTATGLRMRGGTTRHAIVDGTGIAVTSIFSYINGPTSVLFAANDHSIYNITTPTTTGDGMFLVDGDGNFLINESGEYLVTGSAETAVVGGLTGGDWSVVQFATSGGTFLCCVNGADAQQIYDGSTWATTPAITVGDSTTFSNVWSYKNRLFYIQKDTLDAWYLAVDTIGGDADLLPLGAVFSRGGSLLFGHAWSLDTGSGLNEQCVFITTEGEVAVYQGSDPGDANAWSKVGVYRIGRPLGPKAFIRAGGDLIIATDIGFVALSQAINRDIAALSPVAVSYPIQDAWKRVIDTRPSIDWQCEIWPTKEVVAVSFPATGGEEEMMFIANANTGAWTKYTGWNATCIHQYGERFFYGTSEGFVVEAEVTGADQETPYTAVCVPMFDPLKTPASLKSGVQARLVYRASAAVTARLSLQKDFMVNLPPAPDDTRQSSDNVWGVAVWGASVWGATSQKLTFQPWRSVPGSGYSLAPASQVTSGSVAPPDIEMVQTDLTYEVGDIGT